MYRLAFSLVVAIGSCFTLFAATIQKRDGQFQSGQLEKIDNTGLRLAGKNYTWNNIRGAYLGESFSIPVGLQGVRAKIYRGSYPKFPDVGVIKPSSTDEVPRNYVTVSRLGNVSGAILFEGKLDVPRSGAYQFHMASDDGARLFVGGKMIADIPAEFSLRRTVGSAKLMAGSHDFRLEYLNLASHAILELEWSGPGLSLMPLSSVIEQPRPMTSAAISAGGALAWNGSYIAHPIKALTESRVHFADGQQHIRLSTVNLSAIFFKPISLAHADRIRFGKTGRPGVLLNGGDFQEGEIISIQDKTITIKTLLFGEKKYQVMSEALAVFFQKPGRAKEGWTVRTVSGTEIKLKGMMWDKGVLVVDHSPFHNLQLKGAEIAEISFGTMPHVLHRAWAKWDAMAMPGRNITKVQQSKFDSYYQSRANIRAQRVAYRDRLEAANAKLKEIAEAETIALAEMVMCEKAVYASRTKWQIAQAKRESLTALRDDKQQALSNSKAAFDSKEADHSAAQKDLENSKKQENGQSELATKTHTALLATNAKQLAVDEGVLVKATEVFAKAQTAYIVELNKTVKAAAMELAAAKVTAARASADKSVAEKSLVTMKSKLVKAQKEYADAENASKVASAKATAATVTASKASATLTAATKDVAGKSTVAAAVQKFHEGLVKMRQKPAMLVASKNAAIADKAVSEKAKADKALATAKAALAKATSDLQVVEKASKTAEATAATAKKTAVNAAATLIKATTEKMGAAKAVISTKDALMKATIASKTAYMVAQAAVANSKAVGADPKKPKAEKDKAMAEAVAKRKLADTAKRVLEMANSALVSADKSKKAADIAVNSALAADIKAKAELAVAAKGATEKSNLLNAAKASLSVLDKSLMSTEADNAIMTKASVDAITNKANSEKALVEANTNVASAKAAHDTAVKAHLSSVIQLKAAVIADTKAKAEQVAASKVVSEARAEATSAKIMNDKLVVLVQAGEQGVEAAKKSMADSKAKLELAQKHSDNLLAKKKDADLKQAGSVEVTAAVKGARKSNDLAEGAWNLAVQQFKESEAARNKLRATVTAANNTFNNAKRDRDAKLLALKKAAVIRDNMLNQQQLAHKQLEQVRGILAERESLHQKEATLYRALSLPISNTRAHVQVEERHVRDLENDQRRIQDLSKKAALAAAVANRDWAQKNQLFNTVKWHLDKAVTQQEQPALKSWQAATNSLGVALARSRNRPADTNLASQLKHTQVDAATKDGALREIRLEIGKLTASYQKTQLIAAQARKKDLDAKAMAKLRSDDLLLNQKKLIETRRELSEAKSRVVELLTSQAKGKKAVDGAAQSLGLTRKELTRATANFTKINAACDAAVNAVNLAGQSADKTQVVFIAAQLVLKQLNAMLAAGEKELLGRQQTRVAVERTKSLQSGILQKAQAAQKALGEPLDSAQQNLVNLRVVALQAEAIMIDRKRLAKLTKLKSERATEQQRATLIAQIAMATILLDQAVKEKNEAARSFKEAEQSLAQAAVDAKSAEEAEVAARSEYQEAIKKLTSAAQLAQITGSARAVVHREQAEAEHVRTRFLVANRLMLTNP
jgi:hypothetical protein